MDCCKKKTMDTPWWTVKQLLHIHCSASKTQHCSWELPFSLKGTLLGLINFMEKMLCYLIFVNSQLRFETSPVINFIALYQSKHLQIHYILVTTVYRYFLFLYISCLLILERFYLLPYRNLLRTRRLMVFVCAKLSGCLVLRNL